MQGYIPDGKHGLPSVKGRMGGAVGEERSNGEEWCAESHSPENITTAHT